MTTWARRAIWEHYKQPEDAVLRGAIALHVIALERMLEAGAALSDLKEGRVTWNELVARRPDLATFLDLCKWRESQSAGGPKGKPKGTRQASALNPIAIAAINAQLTAAKRGKKLSAKKAIEATLARYPELLGSREKEDLVTTVLRVITRIRKKIVQLKQGSY